MKSLLSIPLLAAALLLPPSLKAQSPIQTPKFDIPLFLGDVASRSFDVTTTNHALKRYGREAILPPFVVNHTAVLVTFEAVDVGGRMYLQHKLIQYHHPKWARAIGVVDLSVTSVVDIHNNRIREPR